MDFRQLKRQTRGLQCVYILQGKQTGSATAVVIAIGSSLTLYLPNTGAATYTPPALLISSAAAVAHAGVVVL